MAEKKDALTQQLLGFITDRKACTKQILESLEQVGTITRGMDTLITSLEIAEADKINVPKVLIAMAKSIKKLSKHSQITAMLALIYVDGGNFDTDVALMLNRLGKGQEALKSIFKKKMEGG